MKMIKGIITSTLAITLNFANIAYATNQVDGDFNGDGNQDAFNQAINPGESSSLTPLAGSSIPAFHKSWATTHPDISTVTDWSADSYGAYSANINNSPGEELLLLGKRKIILIHGDIIIPITLKPDVENAVISWSAAGVASIEEFDFDGNPDDFKVQFGDFNGDGYSEIVLQGNSLHSDSYILNSNGSVRQTLSDGYLGIDWSVAAHGFVISDLNGDGIADITLNPVGGGNSIIAYSSSNGSSSTVYLTEGAPPVTPNAVPDTLPTHDPSAGAIAGQFNIDESGQANYGIQIATVAGRGGVAPAIGLSYSSQGGNGHLGMGWNITGRSTITRCRQTFEQDGYDKAVDLTANDRFCMDGQRLMLVEGTNYGDVNAEYRTEIDTFLEIKSSGGTAGNPDKFSVHAKDSSVSEYGYTGDSKQYSSASGFETVVTTWAQNKFTDNPALNNGQGNSYSYVYDTDQVTKEFTLSRVNYTGDGSHYIEFTYDDTRKDKLMGYAPTGAYFEMNSRLNTIESFANGLSIRKYNLTYDEFIGNRVTPGVCDEEADYCEPDRLDKQYGFSRLTKIEECAQDICLSPTIFDWLYLSEGYEATPYSQAQTARLTSEVKIGDVDGDGRQDIYWRTGAIIQNLTENGSNFYASQVKTYLELNLGAQWRLFDYNADGISDLLHLESRGGGNYEWVISLGDGQKFNSTTSIGTGVTVNFEALANTMQVIDINGDSLPDLVYGYGSNIYVKFLTRNSFNVSNQPYIYGNEQPLSFTIKDNWGGLSNLNSFLYSTVSLSNVRVVDFNADGKVDILADVEYLDSEQAGSQYIKAIFTSNGNGSFKEYYRLSGSQTNVQLVDINNDGLTDLFYKGVSQDKKWYYQLNLGKPGSTNSTTLGPIVTIGNLGDYAESTLKLSDYDYDGNLDIIFADSFSASSNLTVLLWNGNSFDGKITTNLPIGDRIGTSRLWLDTDGDGSEEYFRFTNDTLIESGNTFFVNYPLERSKANYKISKIDNGLGVINTITYKPLTDPNVYTKGENSQYMNFGKGSPVFDVISPMYVVSEAETTSPGITGSGISTFDSNGMVKVKYRYLNMRMQSGGRGSLGFGARATLDPQVNIETYATFKQDFPYTGRPQSTIRRVVQDNYWPEQSSACSTDCPPPPCIFDLITTCNLATGIYPFLFPELDNSGNLIAPSVSQTEDDSSVAGESIELSRETNTWNKMETAGINTGIYFPHLEEAVQVSRTIDGNASLVNLSGSTEVSMTTVNTTYDNWGNIETIISVIKDSNNITLKTVNTVNTYQSEDHKRYGRLTGAIITTSATTSELGLQSVPRETSFVYDPTNWLLIEEIIEPNGDNTEYLKTVTDYDEYGNTIKKTTCSSEVVSCGTNATQDVTDPYWINRWVETEYLAGTYPEKITNAQGQVLQEIIDRNNLGQVTDSVNLFGKHSYQQYDEFGFGTHSWSDVGAEQWTGVTYEAGSSGIQLKLKTVTLGAPTRVEYRDSLGRAVRIGVKGFDGLYVYKDALTDTKGLMRFSSQPFIGGSTESSESSSVISSNIYWTENTYDNLGRVIETKQPDSFTNTIDYIGLQKVSVIGIGDTQINGGVGLVKTETKNALGQLSNIEDAIGGTIDYHYDLFGKLRLLYSKGLDGNNTLKTITTDIQYDSLSRKIATIDPDMGTWNYEYNAIGELTKQIDAKLQTVENFYDNLGRLVRRTDKNSVGQIEADSEWNFDPIFGHLNNISNNLDNNYFEEYEYDNFGRIKFKTTLVDVDGDGLGVKTKFTQQNWYDNAGRVSGTASNVDSITGLPLQGLPVVANEYNNNGYLEQLRNATDDSILWKALETDNFGNVTTSESGDGRFISRKLFNPETGLVVSHSVQRGTNLPLQHLSYQWDTLGNLRLRKDLNTGTEETFGYDELNRLMDATIGSIVKSYQYDDFGNITRKDNKDYLYQESGNAGPHAVTSVAGIGYIYDANGNQTSGDGRALTYATFGKPIEITKGTTKVKFSYSPSRSRYKKLSYINSNTLDETKITAGGVEVIYKGDTTEVRSYITDALMKFTYTGSSIIPTKSISYLFKDHLGSTDTIVTPNGNLDDIVKMSFGSFGERRNVDWDGFLPLASTTPLLAITDKGYTGHEQLDNVGLIHMNGRVYDPAIGRFMSADPNIQAPTNTQSLNRYSYVLNNPLSATDPSGYFFAKLIAGILKSQVFNILISRALIFVPGVGAFLSAAWTVYSQAQSYVGYANLAKSFSRGDSKAIASFAFSSAAGSLISSAMGKGAGDTTEKTSSQKSIEKAHNKAQKSSSPSDQGQNISSNTNNSHSNKIPSDGREKDVNSIDELIKKINEEEIEKERIKLENQVDALMGIVQMNSTFHNGEYGQGYANSMIGGFIFKNETKWWDFSGEVADGYFSGDFGIRSPDGLVERPGVFNGSMHGIQENSMALVIVMPPGTTEQQVINRSEHFLDLSKIIKAPIYISVTGQKPHLTLFFCDNCSLDKPFIMPRESEK